ncbi:MAG: hypothetical protein GY811_10615 [Myxococcales bacterium]|nr:hypothetical protein [Myxococcales bacterium]
MAVALATIVGFASAVSAETLQNDGFADGLTAGFQAGFVATEQGAVRLSPSSANPWKLDNVRLLFGGALTSQTVTLRIFEDTGADNPGAELFSADYQLTGADDALTEIDLSGENIIFTGDIRVSIGFQHDGVPSIARDADGTIDATRNFILASGLGWFRSNYLGLTGDWVIRANVTEQGGGGVPDAGPSGAPDAAPSDSPDAGTPSNETCTLNSDCTNGSYCGDDSTCTFDCRVDVDCSEGSVCDETGRCVESESESSDCGGCNTGGNTPLGLLAGLFMTVLLFRRRRI